MLLISRFKDCYEMLNMLKEKENTYRYNTLQYITTIYMPLIFDMLLQYHCFYLPLSYFVLYCLVIFIFMLILFCFLFNFSSLFFHIFINFYFYFNSFFFSLFLFLIAIIRWDGSGCWEDCERRSRSRGRKKVIDIYMFFLLFSWNYCFVFHCCFVLLLFCNL